MEVKKKKQNHISRQLEEIQTLLKNSNSKPLNFVEAAQYLSISQSTLYKLTYRRKIPSHKPTGKLLYFFKHELDEWISKVSDETSNSLSAGRRTKRDDSSTPLGMTKQKKKSTNENSVKNSDITAHSDNSEEEEPP